MRLVAKLELKMRTKVKIVKHGDIDEDELQSICLLKEESWPFGLNEQKKWIHENIQDNELHLMIYDERLVGYSNLVNRKIIFDKKSSKEVVGIGNVCIAKNNQRSGYGNELMIHINRQLTQEHKSGILLCKDSIVEFYKKNFWVLIESSNLGNDLLMLGTNLMTFNLSYKPHKIELEGPSF